MAHSDHIAFGLDKDGVSIITSENKPFRLESMWVGLKDCADIIEETGRYGSGLNTLRNIIHMILK